MKINKIALLGLASVLAVACSDDEVASTKGSIAVSVQVAADLTNVTSVKVFLFEAGTSAPSDLSGVEPAADMAVSGTTLASEVVAAAAGSHQVLAVAYAGDATIDGARASLDLTVVADGVSLAAFVLTGSKNLVIGGITASNGAPKTDDVVTMTAAVSGNSGGSLLWTDNCGGDFVTNGAVSVDWSSRFVESCVITLTATNAVTSATATLVLSVNGQKGSLQRFVGSGACFEPSQVQNDNGNSGDVWDAHGWALRGNETATSFPMTKLNGLTLDNSGNLIIPERNAGRVWKYTPSTGALTRIAGPIDPFRNVLYTSGDGGPALDATFEYPFNADVDSDGNIYVIDPWQYVVRKIYASDMTIDTYAGGPWSCCTWPNRPFNGYDRLATSLYGATSVAVDDQGNLYVGDSNYWSWAGRSNGTGGWIAKVFANSDTIYTYPETLTQATADVGAWDLEISGGFLYSSGRFEHTVSRLNLTTGDYEVIGGQVGQGGNSGDGGDATEATLFDPRGLFVDAEGDIFVSDTGNNQIRVISASGTISTVVKTEGSPRDLIKDAAGNLYYTDGDTCSIFKVYGPY